MQFISISWATQEMKLALRKLDFGMLGVELQKNKSMVNKFWFELNWEINKIFDGSRNRDSTIYHLEDCYYLYHFQDTTYVSINYVRSNYIIIFLNDWVITEKSPHTTNGWCAGKSHRKKSPRLWKSRWTSGWLKNIIW